MVVIQAETYGKHLLTQIFTHVWYGDWDRYEDMINQIPEELARGLPFHPFYERKQTSFWYDNYFLVPGDYFIPPYVSSYRSKTKEDQHQAKKDLLCLIGAFDKVGFYYPLEQEEFPDHIGSITAFIAALLLEEINAYENSDEKLVKSLKSVKKEVYENYFQGCLEHISTFHLKKVEDPFFKKFLPYYMESIKEIIK
ncbi:molecular chaperone TorD family protein [Pseudogracilibacillus sp. SO30301A]|uniref:molecular chaperone TorD family protein n=1 Tax=Pseudogracilibacillus sp. SO30301A TaxID=3098291 RepID=UPI00300E5948